MIASKSMIKGKSLWDKDLRELIPDVPDFDKVMEKIRRSFEKFD